MHLSRKLILVSTIGLMCILSTTFGLNKISALELNHHSYTINDAQLIAKGGHHGGHHHAHHHHHHHHHHPHHHHHHVHHGHHHFHGHHPHHWHHDGHHHGWSNSYWNGGTGGVWGNNPGYLYDPNFYYDTNGIPSVPYETPLVPQPQGLNIENTFIQTLPEVKVNEGKQQMQARPSNAN